MNDATPLSELRLTLDFSQISTIIARAIRTDHHKEADPGYGVVAGQASARNLRCRRSGVRTQPNLGTPRRPTSRPAGERG